MGRLPLSLLASARPLVFALPRTSPVHTSALLTSQLSRFCSTEATSSNGPPGLLDFNAIDKKWRHYLNHPKNPPRKGKKYYILSMFPYPSGILHMGHLRVYTISDVLARFQRMRGCQVIHPMGWDAFGLPAENAAIEKGVAAREWTEKNIEAMKEQFSLMNVGFDWDREIKTCSPEYYVHTQRLFLDLYNNGLAYRADSVVNWDPVDKTVLANEQVSPLGISWRSGAIVEKVSLKQWFFKITAFSDQLLDDIKVLEPNWPPTVTKMQVNWICGAEGVKVTFPISTQLTDLDDIGGLEVFTTRLDTIHGVQFLAVSTSHPLAVKAAQVQPEIERFLEYETVWNKNSKKGFEIKNVTARNPLTGETVPIFVARYVLAGYGTGALMGVPGHDIRDQEFWKKRAPDREIKVVIEENPEKPQQRTSSDLVDAFTDLGILKENCGEYAGMTSENAREAIEKELRKRGLVAPHLRLRDWLVSRQRYWGTPIPMVHCESCGVVPVKDEDLPVVLPEIEKLSAKGGNPLANVKEWVETVCPNCGGEAKRETDTMDTFVDSSWYFMRYVDSHNKELAFSPELADSLLPVDAYVGGIEHAILHLLYSRFIAKFMHSCGKWPSGGGPGNKGEPFKRLITQGMVLGKTYTHPRTKQVLSRQELKVDPETSSIRVIGDGLKPWVSWEKMSKSKFNGIDPQECIERWGADATRAHLLFQGRVEDQLEWDEERIIGVHRWFSKLWKHVNSLAPRLAKPEFIIKPNSDLHNIPIDKLSPGDRELWGAVQLSIRNISFYLSKSLALNTVISALIKLTNSLTSSTKTQTAPDGPTSNQPCSLGMNYRATDALLRMLAPVAPAFSEECWQVLHTHVPQMAGTRALESTWPWFVAHQGEEFGGNAICAIQINGRVRAKIEVDRKRLLSGFGVTYIKRRVKQEESVQKWLDGGKREIKKVFISPNGKVVNLFID